MIFRRNKSNLKKTFQDIDWVTKVLESKLSLELVEKVKNIFSDIDGDVDIGKIADIIMEFFQTKTTKNSKDKS